jgi:predicted O-methyltransferase YrrM
MVSFFAYLKYLFSAVNEHGVHSPFLFNLYLKVIKAKSNINDFTAIEQLRRQLGSSNEIINITDLGAGSKSSSGKTRTVKSIVRNSISSSKRSHLQYRLIKHFKPEIIIELGTSLGINTAYMALAQPDAKVLTFEGCPEIASKAKENLEELKIENVEIITGNFDQTFPQILQHINTSTPQHLNTSTPQPVYIYFDGNHKLEPTLRYFKEALKFVEKNTVMVFDDIHWSEEMEQAWEEIKNHSEPTMTVDLFDLGIVFFDHELSKQNFILRF